MLQISCLSCLWSWQTVETVGFLFFVFLNLLSAKSGQFKLGLWDFNQSLAYQVAVPNYENMSSNGRQSQILFLFQSLGAAEG